MSIDMGFNIQWCSRIEKEERAFLKASEEGKLRKKEERRKQRRKSRGADREADGSRTPLSLAGSSSLSHASLYDDDRSSLCSGASRASRPQRAKSQADLVPAEWKAMAHFPVVDKDMMTARVVQTTDGTIPTMTLRRED
ncbi:unnamed protein product, partial [Polarella glacialis]